MNTQTNVRQPVQCAICNVTVTRVVWNYGKNRPITHFFCDNVCKAVWQRRQRELLGFTREWLIDQYIVQEKSANQIAREIKRDSKRVWEWIRDYGIPTRKRGHDTSHLPKDGSTFRGKKHSMATRQRLAEIAVADGRVPFDPNVGSYMKGRTGKDHPNWKGGVTAERQAFYSTEEWKEAVKGVWKRTKGLCERCGVKHNTKMLRGTFHIHHIVSFRVRELRTEQTNLALLCRKCHLFIHSKKNVTRGVY